MSLSILIIFHVLSPTFYTCYIISPSQLNQQKSVRERSVRVVLNCVISVNFYYLSLTCYLVAPLTYMGNIQHTFVNTMDCGYANPILSKIIRK